MARGKKTDIETKEEIDSYNEIEKVLDNPIEEDDIHVELDHDGRRKKIESEIVKESLTLRQERFCQLYALDTRFIGN